MFSCAGCVPTATEEVSVEDTAAVNRTAVVQVSPSLQEPAELGTFQVLVVGAWGLRGDGELAFAPACDCFVQVDAQGGSGFQTPAIKDPLEPLWRYEGQLQAGPGAQLSFVLLDKVGDKELEEVGRATLEASDYQESGYCGDLTIVRPGENLKEATLRVKVRRVDQQFPDPVGAKVSATLERKPDQPLGLRVDDCDGQALHITGVEETEAVQAYNSQVQEDAQLTTGLYVVAVNGVSGNAAEMRRLLESEAKVELLLRRPQEFPIAVETDNGDLGVETWASSQGMGLVITAVKAGAVAKWNTANPDNEVLKGDRIVMVNGLWGDDPTGGVEALGTAITSSKRMLLMISRPASDTWWGWS